MIGHVGMKCKIYCKVLALDSPFDILQSRRTFVRLNFKEKLSISFEQFSLFSVLQVSTYRDIVFR